MNLVKNVDASPSTTNQLKSIQKSASLEFFQTPKKYRRRPLTQDEIDLVTVRICSIFIFDKSVYSLVFLGRWIYLSHTFYSFCFIDPNLLYTC